VIKWRTVNVQMSKLPGQTETKFPLLRRVDTEKNAVTRLDGLQKHFEIPREAWFAGFERTEKCHGVKPLNRRN